MRTMNESTITITGDLGSGKSLVSNLIASRLGCEMVSLGAIQRRIAQERNLSTLELNKLSEVDPSIDQEIDSLFESLRDSAECKIVDSRMAWHFLPDSFKVYLTISITTAAKRILADSSRTTETYSDLDSAIKALRIRKESELKRFVEKYGADSTNIFNFDLVVDSTYLTPDEVTSLILRSYESWKSGKKFSKYLYSPKRLYPTQTVRGLATKTRPSAGNGLTIMERDVNDNVKIIMVNDFCYIWDGHHRVSEAIRNGEAIIPCTLAAINDEVVIQGLTARQFVEDSVRASVLYDWEDANGFVFDSYP